MPPGRIANWQLIFARPGSPGWRIFACRIHRCGRCAGSWVEVVVGTWSCVQCRAVTFCETRNVFSIVRGGRRRDSKPPCRPKGKRNLVALNRMFYSRQCLNLFPSSQLPTVKSVIGVLRHLTEAKVAYDKAVREVSKLLYAKWFHDTVYCIPVNSINRKLENVVEDVPWGT